MKRHTKVLHWEGEYCKNGDKFCPCIGLSGDCSFATEDRHYYCHRTAEILGNICDKEIPVGKLCPLPDAATSYEKPWNAG